MGYKTKVCQVCGKEYLPTSNSQKYCIECALVVDKISHVKARSKWQKANPEKFRELASRWDKANPEKSRAYKAKWRKVNGLRVKAINAIWARANPEKFAVHASKRRALKYANTPLDEMLTSTEWITILAEANGHCHYCGKIAKLTLDHVIPLSKGGKHSKDNVVAACLHCNCSKNDRTLEDWNVVCRSEEAMV